MKKRLKMWLGCLCMVACLGWTVMATAAPPAVTSGPQDVLIRYPTMHGNSVVFEAAGNLWRTTLEGGTATQLTADSGFDMAPHYSPDGKWVAFTGWYQGNTDVYVIPATGGPVRRLTYHSINRKAGKDKLRTSQDNIVLGWTPDSKQVVFLSRRTSFNPQVMHAFTVPLGGGLPTQLPLPWTGPLSFNASGTAVAYNKLARVYRPFHRKHYYGGQAQDIWTYDFKTEKSRQITHWKGADVWPMWHEDTIYFTSDRGDHGVQNLWSYSLDANRFTQLTHFDTYDLDSPTLGDDGIALSDGGDLYVYSFKDSQLHRIHVRVPLDGTSMQPHWADAGKMINGAGVAPNGKLAVFSGRGALFTVPATHGSTQTLTRDASADERDPVWSPDGKQIAYILASGRSQEIALRSATGGPPRLLTHDSTVSYQGPLTWSPDGHWITYVTATRQLWLQNVKTGKRYQVATDASTRYAFQDVAWSPGSDWMAFSRALDNHKDGLFLYHLTDHSLHGISSGQFDDSQPAFSSDGKYLFFASDRLVNLTGSMGDPSSTANLDSSGLYATTLSNNTSSPLAPRQPKATGTTGDKHNKDAGKNKEKAIGPLHIDLAGLMSRAVQLPVPASNISGVTAAKGVVFYSTQPNYVIGGHLTGEKSELRAYDLDKRKDRKLDDGGQGLMLSADGSTLLYRSKGKWVLRPATFAKKAKKQTLDTTHLRRWVQPRAEWATIFGEAWRDVRDYFLNPDLIKAHWAGMGQRYEKLLPRAASRNDVTWVIANMIATFGQSHMYISGGDLGWKSPSTETADLGANFALDPASGRYRLARIFHGDNTLPGYRAPLAQPGLKVSTGDYVLAINGQSLKAPMNPYALLNGTYGTTVSLRLSRHASGRDAWTIQVKPIANATKLHLLAWIRHNRARVDKLSGGKIGYVYLNDFEPTGAHEFIRQYYSQLDKQGIIFDDRWNLGGSDALEMTIFSRIARTPVNMFTSRYGRTHTAPTAFHGYKAVVYNRGSASNGDRFPYMFKTAHLGPIIGDRSWAGVRGTDGSFQLMDGGRMTISDTGVYSMDSKWTVENIGVIPDVTAHNDPGQLLHGHDNQLETTINILMKKIKASPRKLPPPPPWTPAFPPQPAYPKCTDQMNSSTCG
ncbi:S41 family peptidase [Oleiagrimonas sp.]|jgi:tricorn protease|uniref:S41 family peptidase n=1 Tax=Oleiagrimonas sp. TaxID=2010330 RepID=UPI002622A79F|nr:S41 family peptidase [Oleiagrimonas sp.]MDA3914819.1 PDZ domain-containing protein [Oleiagrimonas sp.]